ncbi:MAG: GNAT family N-acetyltransferase [Asgard group archaeon]|nr:GNAT family N-acetyltransferase [Asgard group archaeon]
MNEIAISDENFTLRPINLKHDFEELIPFYDDIFEKELTAKGITMRSFLNEQKSLLPIFKIMGLFSKNFRHAFDGFLFENNDGKIVSTVNVGYAGDFWEISMVATHRDYRRRGLARKLIEKSIDHAVRNNAKMCILEVYEENTPAFELYKKMEFKHFDTQLKMKLEPNNYPISYEICLPSDYKIIEMKRDKKTSNALYNLEEKVTPKEVITFLPVNKIKYFQPLILRLIRPLVNIFLPSKAKRLVVFYKNKIVANLYISKGRSYDDYHSMDLIIDPDHKIELTEQLIRYALNELRTAKKDLNVITVVRKSDDFFVSKLLANNFTIYESDLLMGLKLPSKRN